MVVGYSVPASVLLVPVHVPQWVHWGLWLPECGKPVLWGWQLVLDCVVVVVRVCRLCVAPWQWWVPWQGLVVVVGVSVEHVVVWCGQVRRAGWVAC